MLDNHWLAADDLAAQLGLAQRVRDSVEQTFERWDGKGVPKGARGEEILLAARLVALADVVEVFHRAGGVDAAVDVARQRRGTQFDPAIVDLFVAEAPGLCADLDDTSTWDAVLTAEPARGAALNDAAGRGRAGGHRRLHRREVAVHHRALPRRGRSGRAGRARVRAERPGRPADPAGRPGARPRPARRAEHHLGQATARSATPRPSGSGCTRTYTERMLACSPALAPLAAIAVQHHERMDGSGYPRGLSGAAISPAGRLLAAADFYHRGPSRGRTARPYPADAAAAALRAEVSAGRLDAEAAAAVLSAAGHRVARRPARPDGLTSREIEVLRLLAQGLSNREIAERLVISARTASHHVEHIYAKTGTANRARASLYAASHGLIGPPEASPAPADSPSTGPAAS